jgi:hypothetical protein
LTCVSSAGEPSGSALCGIVSRSREGHAQGERQGTAKPCARVEGRRHGARLASIECRLAANVRIRFHVLDINRLGAVLCERSHSEGERVIVQGRSSFKTPLQYPEGAYVGLALAAWTAGRGLARRSAIGRSAAGECIEMTTFVLKEDQ